SRRAGTGGAQADPPRPLHLPLGHHQPGPHRGGARPLHPRALPPGAELLLAAGPRPGAGHPAAPAPHPRPPPARHRHRPRPPPNPGTPRGHDLATVSQPPTTRGRILAPAVRTSAVLSAIRGHHERLDGTGSPDGLKGDTIPLLARLIPIPDCFDALTTSRAYR